MTAARWLVGDVFERLAQLPAGSVDCVITSPPYLQLRSYLPADHPLKQHEIGQEDSPARFLEVLLWVMDALWRVLSDDGTFWIILGDTHAGSGGAGGDYNPGGLREGQQRFDGTARKARKGRGGRPPGERTGRISKAERGQVAYRRLGHGGGPLRDRATDEALGVRPPRVRTRRMLPGWPADQSVCWIPHLFGASLAYGHNLLTGTPHRQWVTRPPVTWCKLNPVVGRLTRTFRTATELVIYGGKHQGHYFDLDTLRVEPTHGYDLDDRVVPTLRHVPGQRRRMTNGRNGTRVNANPRGAPPLNWVVNCVPYRAAHYAVVPPQLVVRPVIAGCPPGGTVLDPFAGTGTTLAVATGHGRHGIGIDLDPANAELARQRLGWLLDIDGATT